MSDLPEESLTREQSGPAFDRALARAVRLLRTERGLERRELAERAGLSYTYLSEIETGKKRPAAQRLLAIAQALDLRPHELMALAETMIAEEAAAEEAKEAEDVAELTAAVSESLAERPRFFHAPPEAHGLAVPPPPSAPAFSPLNEPPPQQSAPPTGRAAPQQRARQPDAAAALRELRLLLARLAPEDVERVLDLARRLVRR
jgi:transcriptional regulator with XRE-family HTH domain